MQNNSIVGTLIQILLTGIKLDLLISLMTSLYVNYTNDSIIYELDSLEKMVWGELLLCHAHNSSACNFLVALPPTGLNSECALDVLGKNCIRVKQRMLLESSRLKC